MKVRFTFKTPDVVDDTITRDVDDDYKDEVKAEARRWFRYEEYVTVELDTEAHTAVVVPN